MSDVPARPSPIALAAAAGVLLGVFVLSVAIREPWRGHLAQGDQWVTALALRWSRAWHRDGALASRLALVESPPTAEFAGPRKALKWGLPGHVLLIHAASNRSVSSPTSSASCASISACT